MSQRRIESFLLRIVVEDQQENAPETWRGQIKHISSGKELRFDNMEHLISLLYHEYFADSPLAAPADHPTPEPTA